MLGLEARAIVSLFGRVVGTASPHPATPLECRDDESRRLRIERRDPIAIKASFGPVWEP